MSEFGEIVEAIATCSGCGKRLRVYSDSGKFISVGKYTLCAECCEHLVGRLIGYFPRLAKEVPDD